jgi:hypothetical protein
VQKLLRGNQETVFNYPMLSISENFCKAYVGIKNLEVIVLLAGKHIK